MPVPNFYWVPDSEPNEAIKQRVRRAQFGDGYSQRSRDGINSRTSSWSLSFTNRSQAEADAIIAFLDARGGVEAFTFDLPGENSGRLYVCEDYARTPGGTLFGVSATFKEEAA